MKNFREVNKTTWAWVELENVEIRQERNDSYILVVADPYNTVDYTVLNELWADTLEEAFVEALEKLKTYNRRSLRNIYM